MEVSQNLAGSEIPDLIWPSTEAVPMGSLSEVMVRYQRST